MSHGKRSSASKPPSSKHRAQPVEQGLPQEDRFRADHVPEEPAQPSRPANADTRANDGGRSGSEGNVETEDAGDEDSRSRRRDLGP
jgi:hypothetical protein